MSSEQQDMNNGKKPSVLMEKADSYAHAVYALTKGFPKNEEFGITSQLRRAALSVPLNITEGYARKTSKYFIQFLQIAYGSLKESQYLLGFAVKEDLVTAARIKPVLEIGDEVGAMLWKSLKTLRGNS